MKFLKIRLIGSAVLVCSLFSSFSATAQDYKDERAEQIDRLLTNFYKPDDPGAVVLVAEGGTVIFRKAYGIGNIELNVALNPDMVFRIASLTKQFTAAAIMKLVEQDKIKVDDNIVKYLPDYPTHGHNITIENLLTHTSGIKSYTSVPEIVKKFEKESLSLPELIDHFKNEPMDFSPSSSYQYNNSGYLLLAAIIEKVSSKSYANFIQDEIFMPLEMKNSYYGGLTKIVPGRAMGYSQNSEGVVRNANYIDMSFPHAAGALLSTVDDLWKWDNALYSGLLISEESVKKMTTPYLLSNGKNAGSEKEGQGYGYGLEISELKGYRIIGHTGGINGFSTRMQRVADKDVLVVVLVNIDNHSVDTNSVANQITAITIREPFIQPTEVDVKPSVLKKYVGDYLIEDFGVTVSITYGDKRLYWRIMDSPRKVLLPSSKTDFFFENELLRISFTEDKGSGGMQLTFFQAEGAPIFEGIATRKQ